MARPADKTPNESGKTNDTSTPEETSSGMDASASAGADQAGSAGDAQSSGRSASRDPALSALVERLKSQNRALQAILDKRTANGAEPAEIAREFASAWLPRDLAEREVFEAVSGREAALAEVEIRKDLINILLANLLDDGPRGAMKAALDAVAEQFAAVAKATQGEDGGLLRVVESNAAATSLPVSQIETRFERARRRFGRLDNTAIGEAVNLLAPRRLFVPQKRQQYEQEREMNRYSNETRERDERGRFLPEDERDYGRGRMPSRDEAGRFVGDERRAGGRYEDEDDRRRGSHERGHGGWFGDSEGHAESSRRGWERSDHGRSGWYGDPEGHSEASRRGWERSDHGRSGWYGDREGHAEASRRGWERSDHGRSGWYGDSEGHSEASRRGWDEGHRSQRSEDDEDRYRARPRYEADDRRGEGYERRRPERYEDDDRSNGGRRGWSGDPEGHSEASRRGWEHRR